MKGQFPRKILVARAGRRVSHDFFACFEGNWTGGHSGERRVMVDKREQRCASVNIQVPTYHTSSRGIRSKFSSL